MYALILFVSSSFFSLFVFGLCLIFRKVFFSLHRASALEGAVTGACDLMRDTRDGREKICFFCCCNLLLFACVAVLEIEYYTIQKESFNDTVYCLVTFVKNVHKNEDKSMLNTFLPAQSKNIRKKGIYSHGRAFRIQSSPVSCLGRRF